MKYFIIIFAIILLAIAYVGLTELRDVNRVQQSTIDGLRKANTAQRDSLEKELKVTRDSLEIAFETIRVARKESLEARERTQATIRNLQKIIFVTHSDSSRSAELKSLYKSYQ